MVDEPQKAAPPRRALNSVPGKLSPAPAWAYYKRNPPRYRPFSRGDTVTPLRPTDTFPRVVCPVSSVPSVFVCALCLMLTMLLPTRNLTRRLAKRVSSPLLEIANANAKPPCATAVGDQPKHDDSLAGARHCQLRGDVDADTRVRKRAHQMPVAVIVLVMAISYAHNLSTWSNPSDPRLRVPASLSLLDASHAPLYSRLASPIRFKPSRPRLCESEEAVGV